MAQMGCKCGARLSNTLCPNDVQHYVFTDKRMDTILAKDNINTLELCNLNNYEVWLCPKCKRLYVFEENKMTAKYIYALEITV